jgi:trehalose 6-phosphate synthase
MLGEHAVTWIASAISEEDCAVAVEADGDAFDEVTADGTPFRLRLVNPGAAAYDRYYNVVANPLLWFTHHYLFDLGRTPSHGPTLRDAWDYGYAAVNEAFAAAAVDELERCPDAAVLFHDYHLYLAPGLVRKRAPTASLGHVIHIPWPQSDYWGVLPGQYRTAIHAGLLANDLVVLHTERWRRSFVESCCDVLGVSEDSSGSVVHEGSTTLVRARPISIDPEELVSLARDPAVAASEAVLRKSRPEHLILRVDRTDPAKNIVRGFAAFALLLEEHPEWLGRVGMLALLDPSRQSIPEYERYARSITQTADAVNARFGTEVWRPVDLRAHDNFPEVVAGYKQYDVLFVNSVFDGMNLVTKEGPIVNTRHGSVVLSDNTGAHEELHDYVESINPFDVSGQADALHRALTLPAAVRRRRSEAIQRHVREHAVVDWASAILRDLDEACG